ncbi:MAG: SDR family oxidoreductase [Prevotella sp.]|nr:SDR family oxidoreductase [Prevotella sp.]
MLDYNPFSLEGKSILVTGASSGIGQETAIQCSKLGASLIISGRNEERLNETFLQLEGGGHSMIVSELTHKEEVENLVNKVDTLNGVVLCAGIGMTSPFLFSSRDKYDSVFEINFYAPVELLRLLVKKKRIGKESSVVFVSSIGGVESFSLGNCVYGASKAAINSTMRFCAKELAVKKIRVNTVNPGMVNTKLIHNGAISEEQYELDMEKYPLKRYGEPQDIAYGIIYLLSDASSWVTGHSLVIDGGVTI